MLTTPERKAELEARAAGLGMSSGEYIPLAVDNYAEDEAVTEETSAALIEEVNRLVPRMEASLGEMSDRLQATDRKVDAMLREWGVWK